MNCDADETADTPPGPVTVTLTMPVPAGLTAVISVEDTTVTLVAGVEPKSTIIPPVRFVPVIVTVVPPAVEPFAGLMPVNVGT